MTPILGVSAAAPKLETRGGLRLAPALVSFWQVLRGHYAHSPWAPLLPKALKATFGMLLLTGIGAHFTISDPGGVELSEAAGTPGLGTTWLRASPLTQSLFRVQQAPSPSTAPSAGAPEESDRSPATKEKPRRIERPPVKDRPELSSAKVILNTASEDELLRLPGIGKKRAAAIIELRSRLGRFRSPTDLLRVRGIGPKILRRILPLVALQAEPPGNDHRARERTGS